MTPNLTRMSGAFGKVCIMHREGSVTLHPVSRRDGCVGNISHEADKAGFEHREGSVTLQTSWRGRVK